MMKGLIRAGGRGTRLRPLTYTRAKQLIPIANKPVLFYALETLAEAGVREIGMIVGDTRTEIEEYVGDGSRWGVEVTYIPQDAPLGLAHAVLTAEPFLGESPFVVFLGDNLIRGGIREFIGCYERERPNALILLTPVHNPEEFGVAELDGEHVVRLVEKPAHPPSNLALVGVYIFDSSIFGAARTIRPSARGELEITDAIGALIDSGLSVRMQRVQGWWKDTGKLEDLLEANHMLLEDLPRVIEGEVESSEIIGRVRIEAGARVRESTIRGPAIIGANTLIENAYVGPFTSIGPNAAIVGSEVEYSIVLEGSSLTDLGSRLENSLIGREVAVYRSRQRPRSINLMIGDHGRVGLL